MPWPKGVPRSAETRRKIAEASKGRVLSAEAREKIAASKRGKPRDRETIEKMRAAQKGKVLSAETREKIGASRRGKPSVNKGRKMPLRTELHRQRLAEAKQGDKTNLYKDGRWLDYPRYLYYCHNGMMGRCYDLDDWAYKYYGGRGIEVHELWHDARTFMDWILENLGERPPGHSLDRIDNDGNYEPGNVRWADRYTQAQNRREWGSVTAVYPNFPPAEKS